MQELDLFAACCGRVGDTGGGGECVLDNIHTHKKEITAAVTLHLCHLLFVTMAGKDNGMSI